MDLSLENVTSLEVSQGRRSRAGEGAMIGSGVGLATGLLAGAIVDHAIRSYPEYQDANNNAVVLLGAIGLAGGLGIGAMIGAMSKGESWHRLSLARLRVSALPDSRSPVLARGSVRFEVTF